MAHQSNKFDFMMRYGKPDYLDKAVRNNIPDIGKAKIDVIVDHLKNSSDEDIADWSKNHPNKVVRAYAGVEAKERGL